MHGYVPQIPECFSQPGPPRSALDSKQSLDLNKRILDGLADAYWLACFGSCIGSYHATELSQSWLIQESRQVALWDEGWADLWLSPRLDC